MRVGRLFAIVHILLRKKRVTAGEIAAELEVTERTVYRDIVTLSEAGFPIVTTQGKGGGLGLVESFVLDRSLLTRRDQGDLLGALGALQALGGPATTALVSKLEALFQVRSRQWLEVDLLPWGASADAAQAFPRLRTALLEGRSVEFSYRSSEAITTRRRVDPLRLVFKHRAWYLLAWDHAANAERNFRLSRISDLGVPRDPAPVPLGGTGGGPEPLGEGPSTHPTTVTLVFRAEAWARVYEEFRTEEVVSDAPGLLRVTTDIGVGEWLWGHLLSFGPDLLTVGPPEIRDQLLVRVSQLHENLKKPFQT